MVGHTLVAKNDYGFQVKIRCSSPPRHIRIIFTVCHHTVTENKQFKKCKGTSIQLEQVVTYWCSRALINWFCRYKFASCSFIRASFALVSAISSSFSASSANNSACSRPCLIQIKLKPFNRILVTYGVWRKFVYGELCCLGL